jgi:hypothetical protein
MHCDMMKNIINSTKTHQLESGGVLLLLPSSCLGAFF